VRAALAGLVTPGNHLIGDGGKAIAAFARRAGISDGDAPSKPGETNSLRQTGSTALSETDHTNS